MTHRRGRDTNASLRRAGHHFDLLTTTGVVMHALCGLDIDGRLGLTAIGSSSEEADALYREAVEVLAGRQPAGPVGIPSATSFERSDAVTAEPA